MRNDTMLASKVLEEIPNKYLAVVVAAKRAKAINDGSRPLVKSSATKPSTMAMEEIAAGCVVPEAEELEIAGKEETQLLPTPDDVLDAEIET
jgi:DNA-directed RNA polymerase omega subunit